MRGICWSGGHRGFRSSVDRCADCLQGELETCRAALAASEQRVRDLEREVTVLSKSHDAALIIEENDALRAQLQASEQKLAGMVESSDSLKASINENTRLDKELRASKATQRATFTLTSGTSCGAA